MKRCGWERGKREEEENKMEDGGVSISKHGGTAFCTADARDNCIR
jgi:hypothetical protein